MAQKNYIKGMGIEAVSAFTGLSKHLIRIWERRYGAVKPKRTHSNRRLYTDADMHRLQLLNRAVKAGHRIGDIAALPASRLEALAAGTPLKPVSSRAGKLTFAGEYIETALAAVSKFNPDELDAALYRAEAELGREHALQEVIIPLMEKIGSKWKEGSLRVSQEHLGTSIIRNHIGSLLSTSKHSPEAPSIVTATPVGQLHEIGALIAAVSAALDGWRSIYLGANLPADEIAGAAIQTKARAVALSLVYPADDPILSVELRKLKKMLPASVTLFVGGRAAEGYFQVLREIDAVYLANLDDFRQNLGKLRKGNSGEQL